MLVVETIGRIRREHLGKGKSIKEIARTLHLSRNTVRRIPRSGETAFSYEREVQSRPKLGAWTDELDRLLSANANAAARERLTLIRIYVALRPLGYEGGYDAVRRYARRWDEQHAGATAEAYIPLTFAPGEAYQFDWNHKIVVMDGVTTTVKVAHVRLCYSRMVSVRAYPRESQEMVFDAHDRAFAFFRGACQRGIPDYVAGHIIGILWPPPLCDAPPRNGLLAATLGHISLKGPRAIRAVLVRFARQVFAEAPPKKSKAAGRPRALPVSS